MTFDEILTAARSMPPQQRAQLLASLWDEIAPEDWLPPDPAWVAEAQRRSDVYDRGEMAGSTWAEVRRRARRKAGLDG